MRARKGLVRRMVKSHTSTQRTSGNCSQALEYLGRGRETGLALRKDLCPTEMAIVDRGKNHREPSIFTAARQHSSHFLPL